MTRFAVVMFAAAIAVWGLGVDSKGGHWREGVVPCVPARRAGQDDGYSVP